MNTGIYALDYSQRTSLYDLIIACNKGDQDSGEVAIQILKGLGISANIEDLDLNQERCFRSPDVMELIDFVSIYRYHKIIRSGAYSYGRVFQKLTYVNTILGDIFLFEPNADAEKLSYSWHNKCPYFDYILRANDESMWGIM